MWIKRPGFLAGLAFAFAAIALLGAATAVVRVGQANTYTGGFLNDFGSAKLKPPTVTVATLPAAAAGNASQVYQVTDGATAVDCTAGGGSTRVLCFSNASAWVAYNKVVDATLAFTDVTTGNATSTAHGFLIKSPADATQFLNGGATPGFSAITTPAITAMATLHANDSATYCTGGNYTLTTTPAAVDCPTTDPALTLGAAGTYLILASMCYDHAAATYSANRNLVGSINRTNNTPATLTNSGLTIQTGVVTTATVTAGCQSNYLLYTTANTDDALALFGSVSVAPDAGSTVVARARLAAIRLY
jgi:hypothetical protein